MHIHHAPDQGLGAAVRVMATDQFYLLAGLADANGDPSTPGESLESFFDQKEFFKHIEAGWVASLDNPFKDNFHLTAWQVDERKGAGVSDGWGAAFSFSKLIGSRWLPFLRVGYADGGAGCWNVRSAPVWATFSLEGAMCWGWG